MANVFLEKNCRIFCFNVRGVAFANTSNTFNHIGHIKDIEKVVNYILENYKGKLSLIGFSMGANWVGIYLGKHLKNDRIKLGVGVCCPFDFHGLRKYYKYSILGRLLNYFMVNNYKRYLKRSLSRLPVGIEKCSMMEEIDLLLLKEVHDCDNLEDFYKKNSCINYIDNIDVPMLFLSASDDPIIPNWIIPFYKYKTNENLSFLHLRGGHLGFFANDNKTNAEIFVGNYFDIISSDAKIHSDDINIKNSSCPGILETVH
ncbi:hypothetical protein GINT2_001976 [Glugoides intestinalis]